MHLAGSPGSCFAYLKDCLEEWSKNKKTRMYTVHGGTKISENEPTYMYYKITKHLDVIGVTTRIELLQKAALLGAEGFLRQVLEA